jgi:23S rRNA pseudouridine2605 synthase
VAPERIQKLIAQAGVCSRRDAEALIREGRVTVNGQVAELGAQADLTVDAIKVDGKRLKAAATLRYLLLYKPPGVMTTTSDPEGRKTVLDMLGGKVRERVYPVGRLDYHSEGLVVLTNDGEFALRLAHPRYGVLREYLAKVKGVPDNRDREQLAQGAFLDGQRVVPHVIELQRTTPTGANSWWRVVVGEGKTHEVRELFLRVGHPVQRLIRCAIGGLRDSSLRVGEWRELTGDEIDLLRRGGVQTRRSAHGRTAGSGVHEEGQHLRAGQAHRGGRARARSEGHRQAGVQRKPARELTKGPRRHS